MKPLKASVTKGLTHHSILNACDNSGARLVKLICVQGLKTTRGRYSSAGIGDLIMVSIVDGKTEMKKTTSLAVIVRQKKEYRRLTGIRIKFEDNAAVVIKDDAGNPKGTVVKGPIAKEAAERWPAIAKIAKIIV